MALHRWCFSVLSLHLQLRVESKWWIERGWGWELRLSDPAQPPPARWITLYCRRYLLIL